MPMPAAILDLRAPRTPQRVASSDAELARAAGRGDAAAFEALYERHHRGLLSFCRHMLGRSHDAEDVVQHTFLAADRTFRSGRVPKAVRPWLYTVARNRCVSLLRARRDEQALPDACLPPTESLTAEVERREELRDLLADLRTLPDDQRAALLLSELGDLSHTEVAGVLGVRVAKVKALVFQARRALLSATDARAIPCPAIREELAGAHGSAQRRRHLRDHLERCEGCRAFHAAVRRQRSAVAAILPVAPSAALREGILAGLGAGAGGAAAAGSAGFGALAAKLLAVAAIGGAAAGSGSIAPRSDEPSPRPCRAHRGRRRTGDRPGGRRAAAGRRPVRGRGSARPGRGRAPRRREASRAAERPGVRARHGRAGPRRAADGEAGQAGEPRRIRAGQGAEAAAGREARQADARRRGSTGGGRPARQGGEASAGPGRGARQGGEARPVRAAEPGKAAKPRRPAAAPGTAAKAAAPPAASPPAAGPKPKS